MENGNVGGDYVTRVLDRPSRIDVGAWDDLLARQPGAPRALHAPRLPGCAAARWQRAPVPASGWGLQWIDALARRRAAGRRPRSTRKPFAGEYVFDRAWADAYERHGLAYTPRDWSRCRSRRCPARACWRWTGGAHGGAAARAVAPLRAAQAVLAAPAVRRAAGHRGLPRRRPVAAPDRAVPLAEPGLPDFDGFLATLRQDKRKKIRQERRKVTDARVDFEWRRAPTSPALTGTSTAATNGPPRAWQPALPEPRLLSRASRRASPGSGCCSSRAMLPAGASRPAWSA